MMRRSSGCGASWPRPGPSAITPHRLERQFEATAPNQRWVADFTYIWTHDGWLYVAVVLDLYSRMVVGWAMRSRMTSQLVTDALVMAIWRRATLSYLCPVQHEMQ